MSIAGAGMMQPDGPKLIAESVLRKRRLRQETKAAQRVAKNSNTHKRKLAKKAEKFVRAETFVKNARSSKNHQTRVNHFQKNIRLETGSQHINAQSQLLKLDGKLIFVLRVRSLNGTSQKIRRILNSLRLNSLLHGVFMKVDKNTLHMLQTVEPFVSYGVPSLQSISDLIHKRGHAKINKQRVAITNNKIVEDNLGAENMICIEDLVNEIYKAGPNFEKAVNFLAPFKLSSKSTNYDKRLMHKPAVQKDDQGFHNNQKINKIIADCL
jgi:large subunit ribosomal protein L7e